MVEQNSNEEQKNRSGCWKYGGIGCLVIIILVIVGVFLAYKGCKRVVGDMTEKYTSIAAIDLPFVEASQEEIDAVLSRVESFTNALEGDGTPEALSLTSKDINILINNHPKWKGLAGKAYVTIEGNQLKGDISIPLGEIGKIFEGRFLNGSAVFSVGMEAGRLLVFLDSAEAGGEKLPENIMNVLRSQNMAEKQIERPEVKDMMGKLESIIVKDGSLIITPKAH